MPVVARGCPDEELLTAFVDDELDVPTRSELLAHMESCAACTETVAAQRRIKAMLTAPADGEDLVPSSALVDGLLAIAGERPAAGVVTPLRRRTRRLPTYAAAAASVVVLMVGAFAFIGALDEDGGTRSPQRQTAVVPVTDLTQEHAATVVQAGFGGPGVSVVPVSAVQPVETP